eukprot:5784288-Pleurochrysis_carterae.AAC.2
MPCATGNTVASNYMHMSFAHLKELTIHHGLLSRVGDEILERDNRTTGRIRPNLLFLGGSSAPEHAHQMWHVMRPVLNADGQETGKFREVTVLRKRNPRQSEQFAHACSLAASSCACSASFLSSQKRPVPSKQWRR